MRVTLLEPSGMLTNEMVRDVLGLVVPEGEVPALEDIREWTNLEQAIVYDWAMREHLSAAGNRVQRRARPFVSRVRP